MLPSHAAAAAWRRFSLRAFCHNAIIIVAKKFFNHQLSLWTHISARLWFKSAFASCSFTIDYTIYQSESQCKYLLTGANYTQTHKHIDKSALTSFNSVYFGIHCFWLWFALTSDIILNGIERHNNSNNNNETRKAALPNLYLINALNVCVCVYVFHVNHSWSCSIVEFGQSQKWCCVCFVPWNFSHLSFASFPFRCDNANSFEASSKWSFNENCPDKSAHTPVSHHGIENFLCYGLRDKTGRKL